MQKVHEEVVAAVTVAVLTAPISEALAQASYILSPKEKPYVASSEPNKNMHHRVEPQRVASDLEQWIRKPIEFTNVGVYWVADSDLRFLTGQGVAVFANSVVGQNTELDHFRNNCARAERAITATCSANIRFAYTAYQVDDPLGLRRRAVLSAPSIQVSRYDRH